MKNNFHSAILKCDKLLAVSNWIALAQRFTARHENTLYSHFWVAHLVAGAKAWSEMDGDFEIAMDIFMVCEDEKLV